jgi:hypothetical protein
MAYHLTIRPTYTGRAWEALHLGVLPTTITPCGQESPEQVERVLARMVEVGMLPAHTTWSVQGR